MSRLSLLASKQKSSLSAVAKRRPTSRNKKTPPSAAAAAAAAKEKDHLSVVSEEEMEPVVEEFLTYEKALEPMLFSSMDFDSCTPRHAYLLQPAQNQQQALQSSAVRRIKTDLQQIRDHIPISWSSCIAIRFDERYSNLLRFIITGPADTPYQNGVFLFDLKFPHNYPQSPPSVKFLTTGRGVARMNPNLYENGYICLSLLGTWTGNGCERWQPNKSTLLQLLLSLQGLVLNRQPYYNEPAYAKTKNNEDSDRYDIDIRKHVVNWAMIDVLETISTDDKLPLATAIASSSSSAAAAPSVPLEYSASTGCGFEDLIAEHFRWKRDEILQDQCVKWIAADSTIKSHFSVLKTHLNRL